MAIKIQSYVRMFLAKCRFTKYKLSLLKYEAKNSSSHLALKESDFSNP